MDARSPEGRATATRSVGVTQTTDYQAPLALDIDTSRGLGCALRVMQETFLTD